MFCCRGSSCIDEEQSRKTSKGQLQRNRQLYIQQNGEKSNMISQSYKIGNINNLSNKNASHIKPSVKHVTNVKNDIYVKLNGLHSKTSKGYTEGKYEILQIPMKQKFPSQVYPDARPRSNSYGSQITRPISTKPVRENTDFKTLQDDRPRTPFATGGIRISDDEALAIFDTRDQDSITEDQREVLEQLDDTLNGYNDDDDDDDMPMIVADILPPGVFEASDIAERQMSGGESSEDEPSSGTSSLSKSVNSRTGIISHKQSSTKSRNSVSFKLPEGHVDKPYAPMHTKAKQKTQIPCVHVTVENTNNAHAQSHNTFHVTGSDVSVWQNGNQVYVENTNPRRVSGPFKGSFKSLFYRKYATSELKTYNDKKTYLAPQIMEKVESFESLNGESNQAYHGAKVVAITRRHTFR